MSIRKTFSKLKRLSKKLVGSYELYDYMEDKGSLSSEVLVDLAAKVGYDFGRIARGALDGLMLRSEKEQETIDRVYEHLVNGLFEGLNGVELEPTEKHEEKLTEEEEEKIFEK